MASPTGVVTNSLRLLARLHEWDDYGRHSRRRRTSRLERLSENLAIFDFEFSEAEMAEIARLARRDGRIVDYAYSGSPQWD